MCFCISKFFHCASHDDDALTDAEDRTLVAASTARDPRVPSIVGTTFGASQSGNDLSQLLVSKKIEKRNDVLYCSDGTVSTIITSARKVCLLCNFKVEGAIEFTHQNGKSFRGVVSVNEGCKIGNLVKTQENANVTFNVDEDE